MIDTTPILSIAIPILCTIFVTAFTLYIVRVVRGPTIPDMVLAIDCLSFDLAVFIALLSIYYATPFLIMGALLLALWAFLFDIFIAKYLVRKKLG